MQKTLLKKCKMTDDKNKNLRTLRSLGCAENAHLFCGRYTYRILQHLKYFVIFLFFLYVPMVLSGETLDDTRTYKPGNKHEYSVKGKDLRVCASIIGVSREELEEQCGGKFGDCLEIIDVKKFSKVAFGNRKSIKADYIDVSGNILKFNVVNNTNRIQEIQVTAFDPDYKINKIIDLPPNTTQLFNIPSDRALFVYAEIDMNHHYSLEKHCKEKFGCLKFEDYRTDKWVAQTSGRGFGQNLQPDNDGVVRFKITNDHSISTKIDLYARSSDLGACKL